MKPIHTTIDIEGELETVSSFIRIIGWADDGRRRLEQWIDEESEDTLAVAGEKGLEMTRGLMERLSEFRTHMSYAMADFLLERADTDPEFTDTVYDLTFAEAMGKLAEGHTIACRATRGRRYRLVDGTLSEVHSDGRFYPVDSFDDLQMGSVWRVVEVSE